MRNLLDIRIDWDRHAGMFYVVVDPNGVVLYLDLPRYLKQTSVWNSNDKSYQVLATPEDRQPVKPGTKSSNETSPPGGVPRWVNWASTTFSSIRKWGSKIQTSDSENEAESGLHRESDSNVKTKNTSKKGKGRRRLSVLRIIGNMVLPTPRNLSRLLVHWGSLILWLVGKPHVHSRSINPAANFLVQLFEKTSLLTVCKYLKVSYIVTLKYLSGEKLTSTGELGLRVRLSSGLPSWFPLLWRVWIRRRDVAGIRFVLSLLYSYKTMDPPVKADLSTISSAPWEGDASSFDDFSGKLLRFLRGTSVFWFQELLPTFYSAVTSGCSTPTISGGLLVNAIAWFVKGGVDTSLGAWIAQIFVPPELQKEMDWSWTNYLHGVARRWRRNKSLWALDVLVSPIEMLFSIWHSVESKPSLYEGIISSFPMRLGRLASFSDGGGKSRVIAIPDFWTQLVLKPLHNLLMDLLKLFPQDATFDQDGKLNEFAKRDYKTVYSLDLKAATDLIPFQLYQAVLKHLIGQTLASLWVRLLTERHYDIVLGCPSDAAVDSVRYTRGQPMGALSSWPAMALVHHCLVLFAAFRANLGIGTFKDYLVLGDDVVIASESVALEYLRVCEELGVTISLAKSFVSKETGLLQFASQVYLGVTNLSPVSLKSELNCTKPTERLAQVADIISKWYPGSGISRYIRYMCPRSLFEETIVPSFRRGESHAYIALIVRLLLNPTSTLTLTLGDRIGTLNGWLSSMLGNLNLSAFHNFFYKKASLHPTPIHMGIWYVVMEGLRDHFRNISAWTSEHWFGWSEPEHGGIDSLLNSVDDFLEGERSVPVSAISFALWLYHMLPRFLKTMSSTNTTVDEISKLWLKSTFVDEPNAIQHLDSLLELLPELHEVADYALCVLKRSEKTVRDMKLLKGNFENPIMSKSFFKDIAFWGFHAEPLTHTVIQRKRSARARSVSVNARKKR